MLEAVFETRLLPEAFGYYGNPAGRVKHAQEPGLSPLVITYLGKGKLQAMKVPPRLGTTGRREIVVGPENRISFSDARMPAVLATPWLVAYLEYAARDSIAPLLDEHERSVGTYLEIEHLAPAPEGATVVCSSRVVHVEKQVVTFQIEARDSVEVLARGIHRRRVIDVDRFRGRLERKRAELGGG